MFALSLLFTILFTLATAEDSEGEEDSDPFSVFTTKPGIIGILIGATVAALLGLLIVCCWFCFQKRNERERKFKSRRKKKEKDKENENENKNENEKEYSVKRKESFIPRPANALVMSRDDPEIQDKIKAALRN
jgi:FtsZ-interacting cell division protein ZipA